MIEQPQIPPSARRLTLEEALTPRELDVLRLLLNDRPTNKEIARELVVSVETIKRHMNNIFQKLHVENRRQAIVEARRLGILPPS
jgi:LuxR family maltose regulon positive regulatory protein